jgi:hypothetical protein
VIGDSKKKVVEVLKWFLDDLKTGPRDKAELDFQLAIIRHLRGILSAWDDWLNKQK